MDTLRAACPRKGKEEERWTDRPYACGLPTGGEGGRAWDMRHLYMRVPSPEGEALDESLPMRATRQLSERWHAAASTCDMRTKQRVGGQDK